MTMRAFATAVKLRVAAMTLLAATLAMQAHAGGSPTSTQRAPEGSWREDYAYTLGVQAYVFGFPYVYLPSLRWSWVMVPKPEGSVTPYAPLNRFHHVRNLADASYRDGGSPNVDTLYSIAWVDLSREPVILSHPEMGERYFTFELASLDSDNFAYVGKRTTGGRAGSFALVGPGWTGELPPGVQALPASRTNSALIFGRTLVDGPKDVAAVNRLQEQFTLTPLSCWGSRSACTASTAEVWKPYDPQVDPLAEWKTMNRAMTEDPPEARLSTLLGLFATIGIGPGQDVQAMDEATRRGLARAAVDGRKLLKTAIHSGEIGRQANFWNIPPKTFGRAGLNDDFLLRGALQCMGGIIANEPEEAVYFNTARDGSGQMLDGSQRYTLRFAPGELPDVDAFWSLTLYDPTFNFTANPIDRHALGDRSPGLKRDADGGLTIHIQSTSPGRDLESNWLPSTGSGPFMLVLRTYIPGPAIAQQRWAPPPVTPVLQ